MPYWLECRTDDRHTATLARARGFTKSEERYACLERPLAARLAQARHAPSAAALDRLPRGFRLRELAGESEADSYAELHRAAFGTQSMTGQWRARTPFCTLRLTAAESAVAEHIGGNVRDHRSQRM